MRRVAIGALTAGLVLAGCGGGLYDFATEPGTSASCRSLVSSLPDAVADQQSTPVDSTRVAAWGDPRIVLRCGVEPPPELGPTSRCDDVDGVGWFTQKRDGGGRRFTTIGRDPGVSVEVPSDYQPAATALVDVADAIKTGSTATNPCV